MQAKTALESVAEFKNKVVTYHDIIASSKVITF